MYHVVMPSKSQSPLDSNYSLFVCNLCGRSRALPSCYPWHHQCQNISQKIVYIKTGVGDHLHSLIRKYFSQEASFGCGCAEMIAKMNAWGPQGCKEHLGEIANHLLKKADELGWWKMLRKMTRRAMFDAARDGTVTPRAFVVSMINKAIRMAEEEAAKQPKPIELSANPNPIDYPVDVVYALGTGSIWQDNELRYSLRSLEKYALDLGRVFIVGEKPPWLTGVVHIPVKDTCRCNKDANIINKVRAAIKAGCTERFIFASDDQCLLAPVRLADLPAYASGDLAAKQEWGKGKWWRRMWATRDWLVAHSLPARNFDVHLFQPHSATAFKKITDEAPYASSNGFCINTLTLNRPEIVPHDLGSVKASFYNGKVSLDRVRSSCSAPGRIHLGYNDAALKAGVHRFLAERFPEKSRFETDGVATLGEYRGRASMDGSTSLLLDEEIEALIGSIPDGGRLLEIGTYHGLTAAMVAERRPDVTITCVDPFVNAGAEERWHKNKKPNMILAKGTVDDLLASNPNPFDVALIDGDHGFEPCYRDLLACETLVKKDGIRIAHDYQWVPNSHVTGKRGVQKAVRLFAERYGYKIDKVVGSYAFLAHNRADA